MVSAFVEAFEVKRSLHTVMRWSICSFEDSVSSLKRSSIMFLFSASDTMLTYLPETCKGQTRCCVPATALLLGLHVLLEDVSPGVPPVQLHPVQLRSGRKCWPESPSVKAGAPAIDLPVRRPRGSSRMSRGRMKEETASQAWEVHFEKASRR